MAATKETSKEVEGRYKLTFCNVFAGIVVCFIVFVISYQTQGHQLHRSGEHPTDLIPTASPELDLQPEITQKSSLQSSRFTGKAKPDETIESSPSLTSPCEQPTEDVCKIEVIMDKLYGDRLSKFAPWINSLSKLLGVQVKVIEIEKDKYLSERLARWENAERLANAGESSNTKDCLLEILLISAPSKKHVNDINLVNHVLQVGQKARRKAISLPGWGNLKTESWEGGVVIASDAVAHSLAFGRPFLFGTTGEAFSKVQKRGSENLDFVVSRVKQILKGTSTGHMIQGVTLGFRSPQGDFEHLDLQMDPSWDLRDLVYSGDVEADREFFKEVLAEKQGFAAIMNSRVMKRSRHHLDAVIRFAVCDILNDYKSCHSISHGENYLRDLSLATLRCRYPWKFGFHRVPWDQRGTLCYSPYKFALSMENMAANGYISEKVFNAKFSYSVPVYFGAPDVAEYLNKDAIIHCDVKEETINVLRSFHDSESRYSMLLPDEQKNSTIRASDESLVRFVRGIVEKDLKPCIDEIIRLDQDDEAYVEKLRQPLLKHNVYEDSYLDGTYLASRLIDILQALEADERLFKNRKGIKQHGNE